MDRSKIRSGRVQTRTLSGIGYSTEQRLWLAGARWYFRHWRACHARACWNYLQYRRVRPTTGVSHLPLLPFIARARAHRLIRGRWWLENIEAGFELWHGGRGLATRWFWARP